MRRRFTAARQPIAAAERLDAAERAAAQTLCIIHHLKSPVALYWPVRGEISPLIVAQHLHVKGLALCLPVVIAPDEALRFRAWAPGDVLHKGRYGIDAPSQKAPFVTPQTLLVPLLAFDREGNRLGTGGGYYDRTLEKLRQQNPETKAYGFAFAMQETALLPMQLHDQTLDGIITEKEVVLIS